MAKKALVDVINGTLGKYVHDLNAQSLSLSLWSGNIELTQGFTLNVDAINSHELMQHQPFELQHGHVGFIGIHVPWASLSTKSVKIQVSNVELVVKPKALPHKKTSGDEKGDGEEQTRLTEEELGEQRREEIERQDTLRKQQDDFLKQFFGDTLAKEGFSSLLSSDMDAATGQIIKTPSKKKAQQAMAKAAPQKEGFAARLVRRIVENISFDLKDVHVQFASSSLTAPTSFSLGMVMDELSIFTTNAEGQRVFIDRNPVSALTNTYQAEFLYKSLEVKRWGVYLEKGLGISSMPLHSTTGDSPTLSVLGLNTPSDHSFLIQPLSFQTKLRQLEYAPPDLKGGPPSKYKLEAILPRLSLQFSRRQLELINSMVSTLVVMAPEDGGEEDDEFPNAPQEPLFPKLRPLKSPKEAPLEWWKYAFRSIHTIQNGYPHLKARLWNMFFDAYKKRKEYVTLYKRYSYGETIDWYEPLSSEEESRMRQLEVDPEVAVEGVVKWRTMADAQVKYEQERDRNETSKTLVENVVNLSPAANLGGGGDSGGPESEHSPLGVDEWKMLDSVLDAKEKQLSESQLEQEESGEMHQTSALMLESKFTLESLQIELFNSNKGKKKGQCSSITSDDQQQHRIAKFDCTGVETSYLLTFGGDVTMIANVTSMTMEDSVTGHDTLFPQVIRTIPKGSSSYCNDTYVVDDKLFYMEFEKRVQHSDAKKQESSVITNSVKTRSRGLEFLASPKLVEELIVLFATPPPPTPAVTLKDREQLSTVKYGAMLHVGDEEEKGRDSPDIFYDAKDEPQNSYADDGAGEGSNALYDYASTKASSAADSAMSKLVDKWNKREQVKQKWRVDVEAEAPLIVIPQNCTDPHAPVMVLDLGHFSLSSSDVMAPSVKSWFKNQFETKKSSSSTSIKSALDQVDSYRMQVSDMVLLVGTTGNRDWYTANRIDSATGEIDDTRDSKGDGASKAVMGPLSFQLDMGLLDTTSSVEEDQVGQKKVCVDGTLKKLKLSVSPETLKLMLQVATGWTGMGAEAPSTDQTNKTPLPRPPSPKRRISSTSSTGSVSASAEWRKSISHGNRNSMRKSSMASSAKSKASLIFTEKQNKNTHPDADSEMFGVCLRMDGFALEATSNAGRIEARLAAVKMNAAVMESGCTKAGMTMGCFVVAAHKPNETSDSAVLLHTNIDAVTSFDTISKQSDVMKTLNHLEQGSHNLDNIVPALDFSVVLPSAVTKGDEDDASKEEPIKVDMVFSGLVVHWRIDAVTRALKAQSEFMAILPSPSPSPQDGISDAAVATGAAEQFKSAREIKSTSEFIEESPQEAADLLLLPDIQEGDVEDDGGDNSPPSATVVNSAIEANIRLTSVGLLLYNEKEILYYMTMSSTSLTYEGKGVDEMNATASIGDLNIGEASHERAGYCRPEYRCVLGMSSSYSCSDSDSAKSSLFTAKFQKGFALEHASRPSERFDVIASAHLSPMKCCVVQCQLLSFMNYMNVGVLDTLNTATAVTVAVSPTAASSSQSQGQETTSSPAPEPAQETSTLLGSSQLFIANAAGFEVVVPEAPDSPHFISAGITSFEASYHLKANKSGDAMLEMKGLTAKTHNSQDSPSPLIPEDIVMRVKASVPAEQGQGDEPIDVDIHISQARVFISKTQYAQITKTIECNFGDSTSVQTLSAQPPSPDDLSVNISTSSTGDDRSSSKPMTRASSSSSFAREKPAGMRSDDDKAKVTPNKLKAVCHFAAAGMEVHLCHEAMNNGIVCVKFQDLSLEAKTNPEDGTNTNTSLWSELSLRSLEVKDVRPDSDRKDTYCGYLIKHTDAISDSVLQGGELFEVKASLTEEGDANVAVSLSGMNVVYIPDLVSEILGFTALSSATPIADSTGVIDESLSPLLDQKEKAKTTGTPEGNANDASIVKVSSVSASPSPSTTSSASPSIKSVTLSFTSRRVRALLVNVDDQKYPVHLDKTTFVLQGDIDTTVSAALSHDMALNRVNAEIKGKDFEIYTESCENDEGALQVSSPMEFQVALKYHGEGDLSEDTPPAVNVSAVVLSPIDVSISTMDMALLYRILASIQAAEQTRQAKEKRAKFVANGKNNGETASKVQLLMSALEEDETTSSDDDGTVTTARSSDDDSKLSASLHNGLADRPYMTASVTVTAQQVGIQIINDIHGLDHALVRVMANECTSGGEVKLYEKAHSNQKEACFDMDIGCSLISDYYDETSLSMGWQPLLTKPWQVTMGASRSLVDPQKGDRMATVVHLNSSECRLSVMDTFLVNLGQAQLCFSDAKRLVDTTFQKLEVSPSSPSAPTNNEELEQVHPYCLSNTSGYDLTIQGSGIETQTCVNGEKCYFQFAKPPGKGVGRKRLYGDEAPIKKISLQINTSDQAQNSMIELDFDEERNHSHISNEPTWHQVNGDLAVCTSITFRTVVVSHSYTIYQPHVLTVMLRLSSNTHDLTHFSSLHIFLCMPGNLCSFRCERSKLCTSPAIFENHLW
jgi:hypothetical protein